MIPRIAFLPDCFHEVNGVALTSRKFDEFAQARGYPFLSLHYGPQERARTHENHRLVELTRSPLKIPVDADLWFDTLFLRHRGRVLRELEAFRPDAVHITGPGEAGIFGAWLAHQYRVPLIMSWHTNLHEFAARRLRRAGFPQSVASATERRVLDIVCRYYRLAKVILAPSPELRQMLQERTGRPVHLMTRGCDTSLFRPRPRVKSPNVVLGFVGRLTAEKNLRFLRTIEREMEAACPGLCTFLIVGEGSERAWLQSNLQRAVFPGVLRGEALAEAYASMDIFVFPSETDTYGNVVVEAMASGLPAVVSAKGGPRFLVRHGESGFVSPTAETFLEHVKLLAQNRHLRQSMGEAGRRFAGAQSWDRVFERVYEAYDEAIAIHKAAIASGEASSARGPEPPQSPSSARRDRSPHTPVSSSPLS